MAERQEITVRAELRAGRGKNDSRRLRARGMVPLTIYGGEGEPIAAASGPACSYAPAPSSDRGCLKNSFTGNSNIREVSTIDVPFPLSRYQHDHKRSRTPRNRVPVAPCYRCSIYQPLSARL